MRRLGESVQPTLIDRPLKPKNLPVLATAARTSLFMQLVHNESAFAAWDLQHASAVEDLLKEYVKTLPRGNSLVPPRLFMYQGKAFSRACPNPGIDAPSYCPGDHTVYLEVSLGNHVAAQFGDYGALSILAHEFGHAYMTRLGIHPIGKEGELAADSFAGGFTRYVEGKGLTEPGDIEEARSTFASVGDYEVYHHDHHGTPMERLQAFNSGYHYGFRIPTEQKDKTPNPTTYPQHPTTEARPPTPIPASPAASSSAVPVLGLGLAALVVATVVGIAVTLVRRAGRDESW